MSDDDAIAIRIRRRTERLRWFYLPLVVDPLRRCPHQDQRGIYGDEIIAARWKRARCLDCGRLLDSLPPGGDRLVSTPSVLVAVPSPAVTPEPRPGPVLRDVPRERATWPLDEPQPVVPVETTEDQ